MDYKDYPCSFQSNDAASVTTQRYFLICSKINFALLILAAFCSSLNLEPSSNYYHILAWIVIISLIFSLIFRFSIKLLKLDRKWYDSRAIAESIKTITWRYAMGVNPYPAVLAEKADKNFIGAINAIIKSRPEINEVLAVCLSSGEQISTRLRELRNLSFENKKKVYLNSRIKDQRDWYQNKAKFNASLERKWFWVNTFLESFAILIAIYMLNVSSNNFNPIGLITTLSGIIIGWVEIKRFRELSQSYSLAAQELASAGSLIEGVKDEAALVKYVAETEEAISREHTMWLAKRSVN